jgi:hypothetical protein
MQKAMQTGMVVAIILGVLTIVEYVFAVNFDHDTIRFIGLSFAALGKAALIVYYFMHVYRLWRVEEAH